MSDSLNDLQHFITCPCRHCDEGIQFDAVHSGEAITCPRCGLETILFIPVVKPNFPLSHEVSKTVAVSKFQRMITLGIICGALGVGVICVFLYQSNVVKTWEKSSTFQNDLVQVSIVESLNFKGRTLYSLGGMVLPSKLTIYLNVKNLSKTQKLDFLAWSGETSSYFKEYPELTDNFHNYYKIYQNAGVSTLNTQSIYPGESVSDVLEFEPPVTNFQWLHLKLPENNFGGSGMIRFEIPASQIKTK